MLYTNGSVGFFFFVANWFIAINSSFTIANIGIVANTMTITKIGQLLCMLHPKIIAMSHITYVFFQYLLPNEIIVQG